MKYFLDHFARILLLFLSASYIFSLGLHGLPFAEASTDPSLKVSEAESALQQSFLAVFDTEKVGADVALLLLKLDVAGQNLTEAQNAYRAGNFTIAVTKAEYCIALAKAVADEASDLKSSTLANAQPHWQLTVYSVVGALVSALILAAIWIAFKRSYNERLLGRKPDVESDGKT